MGCSRDELATEFEAYQARGEVAGRTGDWSPWAGQFTEDAVYVEHLFGRFEGREAIRQWTTSTMTEFPNSAFDPQSMGDAPQAWVAHRRTVRGG